VASRGDTQHARTPLNHPQGNYLAFNNDPSRYQQYKSLLLKDISTLKKG